MQLSDYLNEQQVAILNVTTKAAALDALVTLVCRAAPEMSKDTLAAAVARREAMMSTGIGHGLGIPHVRMPGLKRPVVAVGIIAAGLKDYEGLDDRPVHVVVMIAAPEGQHEVYIRLLARVAEALKQDAVREQIIAAMDPKVVCSLLCGEG